MKVKTHHELASMEYEFSTERVFQSGQSFFHGIQNGGSKGAYQPADQVNGDWGFWHEGPTKITRDEALAKCAELGESEVEIMD